MNTHFSIPEGSRAKATSRNLLRVLPLCSFMAAGRLDAAMVQSDGSDGPFNPVASQRLVLDTAAPDGVFNFTTIHIPTNVTITFQRNSNNTPVFFAATGDVIIEGTINVSGVDYGPEPGPGGWNGGAASLNAAGSPGAGPSGGQGGPPPSGQGNAGGGAGMATYGATATSRTGGNPGKGGPQIRRPILQPGRTGGGGSGGGGGGGRLYFGVNISGGAGGGGGGALQVSTPGQFTLAGSLIANGAHGAWSFANAFARGGPGGGGAGGHIELFAGQFNITTNAVIQARGGAGGGLSTEPVPNAPFLYSSGASGGLGYVYFNRCTNIPITIVSGAVVDARPCILSLVYSNLTGQAWLECAGLAGIPYTIQSSTNLADWADRWIQPTGLDGRFTWMDAVEPERPVFFYRLTAPDTACSWAP